MYHELEEATEEELRHEELLGVFPWGHRRVPYEIARATRRVS